jgi:outer membrane lipopolysaccharide assembly protein LptE/RlpB
MARLHLECKLKEAEQVASGAWRLASDDGTHSVSSSFLTSHLSPLTTLLLLIVGLIASGCGYTIGGAYQHNVQTVYVPIATSEDFRRGPEFQLTEAVQKQIQDRTPFRLTKNDTADTKLTMKIKNIRKNVLGTTAQNDARELQVQYAVEFIWEDLRSGRILAQNKVSIEPEVTRIFTSGEFAPELGQSLATGTQEAIDKMARQIVDSMQAPW